MTTIMCHDCQHIVFVTPRGQGVCIHCGAEYEVEVRQTKKTELTGEELKDRQNAHRG